MFQKQTIYSHEDFWSRLWTLVWISISGGLWGLLIWHQFHIEHISLRDLFTNHIPLYDVWRQRLFLSEITGGLIAIILAFIVWRKGAFENRFTRHFLQFAQGTFVFGVVALAAKIYFQNMDPQSWNAHMAHIWIMALYGAVNVWLIQRCFPEKNKMENHEKSWESTVFWLMILFFGVIYSVILWQGFQKFLFGGLDYTLFAQGIWKYSQLQEPMVTFGGHAKILHAEHSHFILALLAPVWWLFDSVYTLLFIDIVSMLSMGGAAYLLARKCLQSSWARIIMVFAVLSCFGIQRAMEFQYHEINLAAVLFLWTFYFLHTGRIWAFILGVVALLLTKESIALWVMFLGVYTMIFERRVLLGAGVSVVAAVYFVLVMKIILPDIMGNGAYEHFSFEQLGATPEEALKTIITDSVYALGLLFTPEIKRQTMLYLLTAFGFISILSPRVWLLALPMIAERWFNTGASRWGYIEYYNITLVPVLAIAAILGLQRLEKWTDRGLKISVRKPIMAGVVGLLFFSGLMINTKNNTLVAKAVKPDYWQLTKEEKALHEALKLVPKNATIHTQSTISNHLSNRDYVKAFPRGLHLTGEHNSKHNFYNYDRNLNRDRNDVGFKHSMDFYAQEPEYALLSPAIIAYPMRDGDDVRYWIQVLLEDHSLIYQKNDVYLFRKQNTKQVIPSPFNN